MKVVINTCYGGFSLSASATKLYYSKKGRECYFFKMNYKVDDYTPLTEEQANKECGYLAFDIPDIKNYKHENFLNSRPFDEDRSDPDLIAAIEELGLEKSSGWAAKLKIVEVPDDVRWQIDDYDGIETIRESGRSWY